MVAFRIALSKVVCRSVVDSDVIVIEQVQVDVVSTGPDSVEVQETVVQDVIEVGVMGLAGPPGGGFNYVHDQAIPSATWVVFHNLHGYPNVTVEDSAGNEHMPDITYDSGDQITLRFVGSFGGKAYLS